jgi:hypothetical protein
VSDYDCIRRLASTYRAKAAVTADNVLRMRHLALADHCERLAQAMAPRPKRMAARLAGRLLRSAVRLAQGAGVSSPASPTPTTA